MLLLLRHTQSKLSPLALLLTMELLFPALGLCLSKRKHYLERLGQRIRGLTKFYLDPVLSELLMPSFFLYIRQTVGGY